MSKSKSKGDVTKSSDVMKKVKDVVITKPVKAVKAAVKEEKKPKKVVKEPTPESSDSEDEETEESSGSDEESDEEVSITNGKTNGVKKPVDSDSDSASSDSSDDEASTKGAKVDSDEDSGSEEESDVGEDSGSDGESDEETVVEKNNKNKGAVKADELNKKLAPVKADESSDEDSDDSDASSDESEEEKEEVKTQPAKRKAEDTESPFAKKTKLAETNGESQGSNLFVGNLSWNVDEEWLTSEFEKFGELSSVRIITDRDTGRSKGFSYVEFTDAANAAKAHTEMQGHELDGRVLNVDFATQRTQGGGQDRSQARAKTYGDKESAPSDTLFVGNLSFDVGQDAVSEAFGEYGTIMGVRLPTDRETGQPKGFGYVTFASVEEATSAKEAMQGYELEGRTVRLDYSQPRPQNNDSPGRGRGGFGGGRGRGGFGDRGGRGGGRGRGGFGDRGGRGGRGGFSSRGGTTNRGGFGDFKGKKTSF